MRLAERLESEWAPEGEVLDLPPVWKVDGSPEPTEPMTPRSRVAEKPAPDRLNGCKVCAIGFGRQDFAGLAAAMIDERARIEFLPQGEVGRQGEFDLFLINCASVEVMKRDSASIKAVLALGTPTIVIGSRAASMCCAARASLALGILPLNRFIWMN